MNMRQLFASRFAGDPDCAAALALLDRLKLSALDPRNAEHLARALTAFADHEKSFSDCGETLAQSKAALDAHVYDWRSAESREQDASFRSDFWEDYAMHLTNIIGEDAPSREADDAWQRHLAWQERANEEYERSKAPK